MFFKDGLVECLDLRDRQVKVWRIAHGPSFRIVALYLAKIRLAVRRKSFSGTKFAEALISAGSPFERPKSFPMRTTCLRILSETQSFNPKNGRVTATTHWPLTGGRVSPTILRSKALAIFSRAPRRPDWD